MWAISGVMIVTTDETLYLFGTWLSLTFDYSSRLSCPLLLTRIILGFSFRSRLLFFDLVYLRGIGTGIPSPR
jgi:hypothetical protein